jgi:hypothetical protein
VLTSKLEEAIASPPIRSKRGESTLCCLSQDRAQRIFELLGRKGEVARVPDVARRLCRDARRVPDAYRRQDREKACTGFAGMPRHYSLRPAEQGIPRAHRSVSRYCACANWNGVWSLAEKVGTGRVTGFLQAVEAVVMAADWTALLDAIQNVVSAQAR